MHRGRERLAFGPVVPDEIQTFAAEQAVDHLELLPEPPDSLAGRPMLDPDRRAIDRRAPRADAKLEPALRDASERNGFSGKKDDRVAGR